MLKKSQSLKGKRNFSCVLKSSRPAYFQVLKIWSCPSPSLKTQLKTQFGIMVSKKVSGKAVVRNRLKRQLKAVLHQALKKEGRNLNAKKVGLSFYQTPDLEKSFEIINKDIEQWLKKLS